jgi:hypothetical protein
MDTLSLARVSRRDDLSFIRLPMSNTFYPRNGDGCESAVRLIKDIMISPRTGEGNQEAFRSAAYIALSDRILGADYCQRPVEY